ncbi:MAG: hypothetical protein ACREX3_25645, partial [Gammaproteobacteria bacterium]
SVPSSLLERRARLVFTSPPYLRVINYGKYNWVRLWMLKEEPREVDAMLMATGSLSKYLQFIKDVLNAITPAVRDDGYVCLMIGDVCLRGTGETTNLAEHVWEESAKPLEWRLSGIIADRLPTEHKVSRIWRQGRGNATKTDRVLILSRRSRRSAALPALKPIRWGQSTGWAEEAK